MNFSPFIYYLQNTATGLCYYKDINNVTQQANIHSGIDVSLPNAPDGWLSTELGFNRNSTYHGVNRAFAEPMKFIKDAAEIIRELFYLGKGIETPLTLIVLKYNDKPALNEPNYKLYYKGQLDLPKFSDIVNEGIQLNLMEGGISQLLKAFENTIFEIKCDGSIDENQKILMDGMLVEDVFNYEIGFAQAQKNTSNGNAVDKTFGLPVTFVSNEGDNFGIIHKDTAYQLLGNPFATNEEYMFKSVRPTSVRIKGTINARPRDAGSPDGFSMYLKTNKSTNDLPIPTDIVLIQNNVIASWAVYSFDQTINLDANESLFPPCVFHDNYQWDGAFAIEGGSFQLSFSSMAAAASVWAVTAYDLFKLLVKAICLAASTTNQTFDYGADSNLLQANLNWMVTSGDALRASGDANYAKYFKQYAVANTTGLITAYGVVIKTCLADFFKDFSALLCASLGNQQLPNSKESIYFETLGYAFNDNANQMDVGEVSNLKINLAEEVMFNTVEIGHAPQSYDQKKGKYEFNGTTKYIAPIKSLNKTFSQITKYRRDSYGIETLRANIGDTSTSRNDSDSSVFAINTDRTLASFDKEKAWFISSVQSLDVPNNNIHFASNVSMQKITMTDINGSYLSMNNDPSIFVFAQNEGAGMQLFTLSILGNLSGNVANSVTGNPADYITIKLYINGAIVQIFTTTSNSASTQITGNYSVTQNFNKGDSFYLVATTSINGSATLSNVSVNVGNAGSYFTCTGLNIPIAAGSPVKMIALPNVVDSDTGKNHIHYGFQYFLFDNILKKSDFDVKANITIVQSADNSSERTDLYLFKNGLRVSAAAQLGNNSTPTVFSLTQASQTFKIGDLFYLLASTTNLNTQVTTCDISFTSSSIRAYGLKRAEYSNISGIPNLAVDVNGKHSTNMAGAAYNIEDTTPKRMLENWGGYIRSSLYNQSGNLLFATTSKNQYLSTTLNGVTYTENAAVPIGSLNPALWHPLSIEFDTKVPINFADLMTATANSVIHLTYNGVNLYGFPITVKQKPALNEKQNWKLRLSTKTNLNDLLNLNIEGLNLLTMLPNSLFCSILSPLQYVEVGKVLDPRFHKMDMGQYWFVDQIQDWSNSDNYWQPWQNNDTVNLQFVTNGLAPVTLEVFRWDGLSMMNITATAANSNAIVPPYFLWEASFSLSTLPPNTYYTIVTAGVGVNAVKYISEGLDVRADWPNTMLFEYTNSKNSFGIYFDTNYSPSIRIHGMIGQLIPEYKASFSIGQREDISILNAYPFKTYPLHIGREGGIPDWEGEKLQHVLLLDGLKIEGKAFSLDENAKLEPEKTIGQNKQYWKTIIRPSKVNYGLNAGLNGIDGDSSMAVTLDASVFGANNGNTSGTIPSDIISVTIK